MRHRLRNHFLLLASLGAAAAGDDPGRMPLTVTAYEPIYFLVEPVENLNAKFQFSVALRAVSWDTQAAAGAERRDGFYFSYSQTSWWDLHHVSKPFFDNSYRPEAWFYFGHLFPERLPALGKDSHIGLATGIGHESNGKAGEDSRSIDWYGFVRAPIRSHLDGSLWLTVDPRWRIIPKHLTENPDIADYRGRFEAHVLLNQRWFNLDLLGRLGDGGHYGNVQVDGSFPLKALDPHLNFNLHAQWYYGYGETLLHYDQRTHRFLVGISFVP